MELRAVVAAGTLEDLWVGRALLLRAEAFGEIVGALERSAHTEQRGNPKQRLLHREKMQQLCSNDGRRQTRGRGDNQHEHLPSRRAGRHFSTFPPASSSVVACLIQVREGGMVASHNRVQTQSVRCRDRPARPPPRRRSFLEGL